MMDMELNKIVCGNAIEQLKLLMDESIDLTITSPPYDNLRTYNGKIKDEVIYDNTFSFPFNEMADQLYRVTKEGGVVVWVVNDQVINGGESGNSFRQALKFKEVGFTLYDTMIYLKNGSPFPEKGRYSQVFEFMFVFSKGKPKSINLIKDKPNKWAGTLPFGTPSKRMKNGELRKGEKYQVAQFGTRTNVWKINNGKGYSTKDNEAFKHPAIFPENLAEDHILTWSNEGDIVLDPMCGSGTTLKMAKLNNRNFIGFDINDDYVKISLNRIKSVSPFDTVRTNPKEEFIPKKQITQPHKKNKSKKVVKNVEIHLGIWSNRGLRKVA